MTASLTIDLRECHTLHGGCCRAAFSSWLKTLWVRRGGGISVAELYERLADDLGLMEDIGWASETDQAAVGFDGALREARRNLEAASQRRPPPAALAPA